MTRFPHNPRPWIVIAVHAVAEPHQAERVILVLRPADILADPALVADFLQHAQHRLVGAAVRRPPQGCDPGRDAGERVGTARSRQANGRGRCVLFMIGVQDEDAVHGTRQHRIDPVWLARDGEHHVQQVFRKAQIIAGIDKRLAQGVLVRPRCHGRHLGDQPVGRNHAMARVRDVGRVMVEGRHTADHAHHHRHRMGVPPEPLDELRHLLMQHGVVGNVVLELPLLVGIGQIAVQQKIAHFHEVGVLREVLDRIAAIQQDPFVTVDVCNTRFTAAG